MPQTFFIADLHIGHKNVIKYDGRPYFTCSEMAEDIISKWNAKVTPRDTVYVVGDMFWTAQDAQQYLPKFNGKIVLIEGNHDHNWESYYNHNKITCVLPHYLGKINKTYVYLSHQYTPFYLKQLNNGVHIYGHSHNTQECYDEWNVQKMLKEKGYHQECYNVGCMQPYMNYEPKTLEELRKEVKI